MRLRVTRVTARQPAILKCCSRSSLTSNWNTHQRAGGLFIIELFVSLKVEIFARLAAPLDLALAVVVALDPPFQLGKEGFRVP